MPEGVGPVDGLVPGRASSPGLAPVGGGVDQPASAPASPRSASRASATSAVPASFTASAAATLTLTNRTCGSANTVRDAVVKSLYRVPIPITTSAWLASRLAAVVPVLPIAPSASGWS